MELHALSGFIVAAIQPGAALADCRKQGSMCQLRGKAARLPWRPRAGGGECKEGALWLQVVRVVYFAAFSRSRLAVFLRSLAAPTQVAWATGPHPGPPATSSIGRERATLMPSARVRHIRSLLRFFSGLPSGRQCLTPTISDSAPSMSGSRYIWLPLYLAPTKFALIPWVL